MITRRNLAEQLRDYQLRSKRDWSSLSFWASVNRDESTTPNRWGLFLVVILLFTAAATFYFRDVTLTLSLLVIGSALLLCCQAIASKLSKRRQRRILP